MAPDWWDIADFVHFFQWTFLTECTGSKKNGMALVVDPPPFPPNPFPFCPPSHSPRPPSSLRTQLWAGGGRRDSHPGPWHAVAL